MAYPSDGKHGVIGADFLGPSMSSSAVREKDNDTCQERHAGHGKNQLLWPGVGVLGPRRHFALVRECLGDVENGKRRGNHSEDDEGAAKADASKRKFGHAYPSFDFLGQDVRKGCKCFSEVEG